MPLHCLHVSNLRQGIVSNLRQGIVSNLRQGIGGRHAVSGRD
jgi:hypothetical protein